MQFIKSGPSIPEKLLHAHEEGRVVFFCGAGISYPAGLPGFKGLVHEVYQSLGETPSPLEQAAQQNNQFDATLDLLERRNPSYRLQSRSAIARILRPKLKRLGATSTHEALLTLAKDRGGLTRLVTTNFDRIFEIVLRRQRNALPIFPAPLLPIPKSSRWDGLVYLHGLLKVKNDPATLNRLVMTSGDFGLAYLTERWASRFVSELFRNFVVCFVGYSINDPVLRYMMDALAADRMLGETVPEAFAFADFSGGAQEQKRIEWKAKGVTPILYEDVGGSTGHLALHASLAKWAETYRDGVIGKERIAADLAIARPILSTVQDDFVGRLVWALADLSGLPARRFAEFNPVPSIEWLVHFATDRYQNEDLPRFDVLASAQQAEKIEFSLVRRPAPYHRAPWMALLSPGIGGSQWDRVMSALCGWLLRHLGDPALFWWIIQNNGPLHPQFCWALNARLEEIERHEAAGSSTALQLLSNGAPNAIPVQAVRVLWNLLLAGRVRKHRENLDLYQWRSRFGRYGLTSTLRMQLRQLLAPLVNLSPKRESDDTSAPLKGDVSIQEIVSCEIVLQSDYAVTHVKEMQGVPKWQEALPSLLPDFQTLLLDALDLMVELGLADSENDRGYLDMPSISPHFQNRDFRDWVALIHLVRDAWLALLETERERATTVVDTWSRLGYPTFMRLALFASARPEIDSAWADWLCRNEAWWLWSVEAQREVMQLLTLKGAALDYHFSERLQQAILAGPPRRMFRDDLEPDRWEHLRHHTTWLRLAKLVAGGAARR